MLLFHPLILTNELGEPTHSLGKGQSEAPQGTIQSRNLSHEMD